MPTSHLTKSDPRNQTIKRIERRARKHIKICGEKESDDRKVEKEGFEESHENGPRGPW